MIQPDALTASVKNTQNLNKNNTFVHSARICLQCAASIGGQPVMEGVMMRNGDIYGLAVRRANGEILAQRLLWKSCCRRLWLRLPFFRGFALLIDTIVNGIHALNRSAALREGEEREHDSRDAMLSLAIAAFMAFGLFVAAPHLLSLLMLGAGLGGDVDGMSFHLWDGLFKTAIFILYIRLIALVPDIRRVLQYHGAEHKAVHAWERCELVEKQGAAGMSRLHPRCGTTFLLFVIIFSIALQAMLVPVFVKLVAPQGLAARHGATILFKLVLVPIVSAVAYEFLRFAELLPAGIPARVLQAPGLCLQRLTTREPDEEQLDVALAALAESLDFEDLDRIRTAPYQRADADVSVCAMI